ncbi:MAG: hypothetical protein ABIH23_35325 [bacterium]
MSEYQYYEFQAVDRPLTKKQMDELRKYSSRAQITPNRFVNVYNYGDFRGKPSALVEEYFDAFLYLANWGTRWLMLRLSRALFDPETAAPYVGDEFFTCRQKGDYVILSFRSEPQDYDDYEWCGEEGCLSSLVPLRVDLLRGDLRALYLGWLLALQSAEFEDDELEPPVPPGLGELNASLVQLADFLRIDADLVAAAAERSGRFRDEALSKEELDGWLSKMAVDEKDALLARLIASDSALPAAEIRLRAQREIRGEIGRPVLSGRSASQLEEHADILLEERERKEDEERAREKAKRQREAAEAKKKHLESLIGKEETLWSEVDRLIATRQSNRYDQAIIHLRDLHDLSQMQGELSQFSAKMRRLAAEHERKPSLLQRLRKAGLLE